MKNFFTALTVLLTATFVLPAVTCAREGFDNRLAGFTAGQDPEARLISLYGPGFFYDVLPERGGASFYYARCYYFEKENAFLTGIISRRTKMIARIEVADRHPMGCLKTDFAKLPLTTGRGARLGMTLREVLQIYGKPEYMDIEELTHAEAELLAKKHPPPARMTPEEYAATFTERREIPGELSETEFLKAFGRPELILEMYKTTIYEWHSPADVWEEDQSRYLYFLKGKVVKIAVTDNRR